MHRRITFVAILTATALLVSCGGATPDGTVRDSVAALKKSDLKTFLQTTTSSADWAEMEQNWEAERGKQRTPAEKKQFEEMMAKLTAKDATETLFAEIEPGLAEMGQQWSMMTGMLPMMAASAAGDNPETQVAEAASAIAQKLAGIDITDRDKVREVLDIVTECARDLDLDTYDDVAALSFDQVLDRGGIAMQGAADCLAVYGLSLDDTLDSVEVRVLSEEEDAAQVEVSYAVFGGTPQTTTVDLELVDGRWIPKS